MTTRPPAAGPCHRTDDRRLRCRRQGSEAGGRDAHDRHTVLGVTAGKVTAEQLARVAVATATAAWLAGIWWLTRTRPI